MRIYQTPEDGCERSTNCLRRDCGCDGPVASARRTRAGGTGMFRSAGGFALHGLGRPGNLWPGENPSRDPLIDSATVRGMDHRAAATAKGRRLGPLAGHAPLVAGRHPETGSAGAADRFGGETARRPGSGRCKRTSGTARRSSCRRDHPRRCCFSAGRCGPAGPSDSRSASAAAIGWTSGSTGGRSLRPRPGCLPAVMAAPIASTARALTNCSSTST